MVSIMAEESINVKVVSVGKDDIVFKLKPTTKLSKLMSKYAESILEKKPSEVTFIYDGQKVSGEDSPQGLGIADGDLIHVQDAQVGGGNK